MSEETGVPGGNSGNHPTTHKRAFQLSNLLIRERAQTKCCITTVSYFCTLTSVQNTVTLVCPLEVYAMCLG